MLRKRKQKQKARVKKLAIEKEIIIHGEKIKKGEVRSIDIPIGKLYDSTDMLLTVKVIRGKKDGPVLLLSSGIHGDELNGVEAIRRLQDQKWLKKINGTLILAPIINVFGFNNSSRYLPDGRDLNRHFPGNSKGSLASRLAHIFMENIVKISDYVIDLHTGSKDRFNLPQIRGSLDDKKTEELALAFASPVVVHSNIRDGSLREAVKDLGIPVLVFEGGESLRFDEPSIKSILLGTKNVMEKIGMLEGKNPPKKDKPPYITKNSYWIRANRSGILTLTKDIGEKVLKGEVIARISDPFNETNLEIKSVHEGIIIGKLIRPLVSVGDAIIHVATFEDIEEALKTVDNYLDLLTDSPI